MSETDFFEKVWEVARRIPHGRVTTYGAIAAYLGSKMSARVVGYAMNASHNAEQPVPAHRVINRKGILSGKHHFGGSSVMRELLESEGIVVENDKVKDFDRLLWIPDNE